MGKELQRSLKRLTYTENPFDLERYQSIRKMRLTLMATYSQTDPLYILNLFADEVGPATPKVDVRGVVFKENKILLVKERLDGGWTLPGGWADVGESPRESVEREVYEESGFQTRAVKLLAVYDRNRHPHSPTPYYVYKLFFQCELVSGEPSPSLETTEVEFFAEHEIPDYLTLA
jgi:ADP-ribose pyrophosphatase YjhB (NUDIX family)